MNCNANILEEVGVQQGGRVQSFLTYHDRIFYHDRCARFVLVYRTLLTSIIKPNTAASNQHFAGRPEYIKHMILNTLHVFYMYNKNNLHPFSIFYNICIFSFLSLCVSKCVA